MAETLLDFIGFWPKSPTVCKQNYHKLIELYNKIALYIFSSDTFFFKTLANQKELTIYLFTYILCLFSLFAILLKHVL